MPRNQTCHLITGQRYGFFTFRINRQNRINYFFLRFFSFQSLIQHILFKKCIHQLLYIGILFRGLVTEGVIERLLYCINTDLAVFGQEPEDGVHSYRSLAGNYPIFFPICNGTQMTVILGRTSKDPVFKPCLRTLKPEKSAPLSSRICHG